MRPVLTRRVRSRWQRTCASERWAAVVTVKLGRVDREQALHLKPGELCHSVDDAVLLCLILIDHARAGQRDRDVVAILEGYFHPRCLEGLDARRHRKEVPECLADRAEVEAE